jgi:hypothetical protein
MSKNPLAIHLHPDPRRQSLWGSRLADAGLPQPYPAAQFRLQGCNLGDGFVVAVAVRPKAYIRIKAP